MEQNLEDRVEFREKAKYFFNKNKKKIVLFLIIVFLFLFSLFLIDYNKKKANNLISEKYIQAGLLLASDQKEESKEIFKEIILSKNKFYSVLALNTIIEKDLEKNQTKVIEYFDIVENINKSKEQNDLILFKKALYLLKISKENEAKKILEMLLNSNTGFESLIRDLLENKKTK